MKITKQRLREIIKEELGLGGIQTEPRFTGGSPEERMLLLIKAGEVLAGLGEEEMAQLRDGLDEETLEALGKLLGNPMYTPQRGPGEEEEPTMHLSAPTESPWKLKQRLGIGGSTHDRLGGPRHREKK